MRSRYPRAFAAEGSDTLLGGCAGTQLCGEKETKPQNEFIYLLTCTCVFLLARYLFTLVNQFVSKL